MMKAYRGASNIEAGETGEIENNSMKLKTNPKKKN